MAVVLLNGLSPTPTVRSVVLGDRLFTESGLQAGDRRGRPGVGVAGG